MKERPYQTGWWNSTLEAVQRGATRLCGIAATGSGKTVYFSRLHETLELLPWEQMLILVEREELVFQAAEKLKLYNPTLRVTIDKAEMKADVDADIIVISVKSIGDNKIGEDGAWRWCKRIQRYNPATVRCVVVDECHHVVANTYSSILRYFGVFKGEDRYNNPDRLLIGVTATPDRPDGKGLDTVFDEVIFNTPMLDQIRDGWLCNIKGWRVDTLTDISEVSVRGGKFNDAELETAINTRARNALIVRKHLELGEKMKGACFTVDIQHSDDLAAEFRQGGLRWVSISSKTPKDLRKKYLYDLKIGDLDGVASCQALLEGWDEPTIGVLHMSCPMVSGLKFRQALGRGVRPNPSPEELAYLNEQRAAATLAGQPPLPLPWIKPYCVVIDYTDVSGKHSVWSVPSIFGLKSDFKLNGRKITETLDAIETLRTKAKAPVQVELYSSVEEIKAATERIDFLAKPVLTEAIKGLSQYAWVTGVTGGYQLSLGESILRVSQDLLGKFEITRSVKGSKSILGRANELGEALKFADTQIPPGERSLLMADAKWRFAKPTRPQTDYYYRLAPKELKNQFSDDAQSTAKDKFAAYCIETYSSGEISMMITQNEKRRGSWKKKPATAGK